MLIRNKNGTELEYSTTTYMMDDDIREDLHSKIAPCTEQEFFSQYEIEHELKYNEEWELSKVNPIW